MQPRMVVATFNGNPRATITSCYSLTNVSEETELIAFYVLSILKHNILVIDGDMNDKIGENGNYKFTHTNR